MSSSPLVYDPYIVENVVGDSFLDVACGRGKWGFLIKKHRLGSSPAGITVSGIDLRQESLDILRTHNIYDDLRLGNAVQLPYDDNSFDTVIACEVIEHLPKEQGQRVVDEAKRVARQCCVISTPNSGEIKAGYDELENHVSSYSHSEFRRLGLTQTIGLGRLRIRQWKLAVAFSPLGMVFPSLSQYLMGFWFADGRKRVLSAG